MNIICFRVVRYELISSLSTLHFYAYKICLVLFIVGPLVRVYYAFPVKTPKDSAPTTLNKVLPLLTT